jgi:four helix bundle protein
MPVSDFRDLECWQLADRIRGEVIAICARDALAQDFRFCEGFRDAAGSVCRNIGEGFSRYRSPDIVQFFRYALASISEVKDYLVECQTRGALDASETERLMDQCEHVKAMMLKFIRPHRPPEARKRRTSSST